MKIENKTIDQNSPIFFIAEAGVNHNGSIDKAIELVDIAIRSGADAVKFQTFKAADLNLPNAPKSDYHIETTGNDKKQSWYDLLKTQELTFDMHKTLINYCKKNKIIFMSTPYDIKSIDLLMELGVDAFKVASTDTNNLPFLKYLVGKKKPIILSTAMSSLEDIKESINVFKNEKFNNFALLQCTGNYPSKISDSNLRVMYTYRDEFNCIYGYSDHTLDIINPIAATAMGAKIFEKHFTINKNLPGPDHRMSLNEDELTTTIKLIRETELSLGSNEKKVLESEKDNQKKLRKSIVSVSSIKKGQKISKELISIKRPGLGIPPKYYNKVLNNVAKVNIERDIPLKFEMLKNKIE